MRHIILLLTLGLVLTGCDFFKVTDPNDPRFNLMKIKFDDYKNEKEINRVLKIIFPIGTEKEEIESLFVENLTLEPTVAWHQKGSMRKKGRGADYYYISYIGSNKPQNGIWREFVTAKYDLEDKLIFNLQYGIISNEKGNRNLLLPWLLND